MATLTNAGLVIAGLIVVNYLWLAATRKKRFPGPPPLPFLGNVHQLPRQTPWVKFAEWGREYGLYTSSLALALAYRLSCLGPVFELSVLGTRVVVLNSAKAAEDLLVKRGTIYAGKESS